MNWVVVHAALIPEEGADIPCAFNMRSVKRYRPISPSITYIDLHHEQGRFRIPSYDLDEYKKLMEN